MTSPVLYPAHDPRTPVNFLNADALAAHLLRQRPGRQIMLDRTQATFGGPMFAVLSVYAIDRRQERAFRDDPASFEDDWLGITAGDGADDFDRMTAALTRIRSAGGLAA